MVHATVADLKADLGAAQARYAQLQEQGSRANDKLRANPTRENQKARDQAFKDTELVDLRIQRLQRDIVAAERTAWEDEITDFTTRQADLEAQGKAIAERLTISLADASNAIREYLVLRQSVRDLEVRVIGRRALLRGEKVRGQLGYSTIALPDGQGLKGQVEELLRSIAKAKEGFST